MARFIPTIRVCASLACLWGLAATAHAESEIDFDTEIVPILTKAGCNSGACHGSAAGRGEFHLSLFGSDAQFDYNSIVHELRGRRVNKVHVDQSLILLKPTEVILHGGGTRLEYEGTEATLMQRWIEQGAMRLQRRKLENFEIRIGQRVLNADPYETTLTAIAEFSDGQSIDATSLTVFTPEDPASIKIDNDRNVVSALRPGRHVLIARYLDRVLPVIVIRPYQSGEVASPQTSIVQNVIDEHVNSMLMTLGIPHSPMTDDAAFVRRATLDFIGRLPTREEIRQFHLDQNANKREQLIDRLLASRDFVDYWTYQFAQQLRIRSQPKETVGARAYHQWLREQINVATPYNEIAASLLLAEGDSHEHGPANFYRTVGGPREQAEFVSELLLGSRLRCANCHDHPLDHWRQDDYHGLAAIFAKVQPGRIVRINQSAEVVHPKTGEAAIPRIPGTRYLYDDEETRLKFSNWVTSRENPYFAKTIVNRLWKELMGRGFVEPTDDLRATNPPTHPELLNVLADFFADNDYRIRPLLRLIGTSAAYARSAQTVPGNQNDDQFYSHAIVRPLKPEVLADALADVTGVSSSYGDEPVGTRAVTLFDPQITSEELDILGRCSRVESCEDASTTVGGLPRMLHQFNGQLLNRRLAREESHLQQMISTGKTPIEMINEFYLLAYSRQPKKEELQFWQNELNRTTNQNETQAIIEDFLWSLCTSQEFTTNH